MDIENIKTQILDDAKSESANILLAAKAQAAEVLAEFEQEVNAQRERVAEEASHKIAQISATLASRERMEQSKKQLAERRKVLDECFAAAVANIEKTHGTGEIVESGKTAIDKRFSEIAGSRRAEIEPEVARILWG